MQKIFLQLKNNKRRRRLQTTTSLSEEFSSATRFYTTPYSEIFVKIQNLSPSANVPVVVASCCALLGLCIFGLIFFTFYNA